MELWLLAGIALFAVIRVVTDLVSRMFSYPLDTWKDSPKLILLTRNSQGCIEWVFRSYYGRSRLSGHPPEIICVDAGSADDTGPILERLQQKYPMMEVYTEAVPDEGTPFGAEDSSILDLRS